MTGKTISIHKNNLLEMLQFSGLGSNRNIFHFMTTRQGGISQGAYSSLNLGEYVEDHPERVTFNRRILAECIGVAPDHIFVPKQVHEDTIYDIQPAIFSLSPEEQRAALLGVDALVTACPGICIAVSTADCVPVLLYDPVNNIAAAIHAGWRGTVGLIALKTVNYLVDTYGSCPDLLLAGIGPSISANAFEVGEEVVQVFQQSGMDMNKICSRHPVTGKAHIDLWKANQFQLLAGGLLSGNIEIAEICTFSQPNRFFSARRLGIKSGRQLTGILIKDK